MKKFTLLLFLFTISVLSFAQHSFIFDEDICAKNDINFTPVGLPAGTSSVVWDWDDGTTSTITTAPFATTHTYIGSGIYNVTMTPNGANPVTLEISVYDKPNLNIIYTSEGVVCAPDSAITIKITSDILIHPEMETMITWGETGEEEDVDINDIINQNELEHSYNGTSCGNSDEIGGVEINDRFMIMVSATNICTPLIPEPFFRVVEIKSKPNAGIAFADTTITLDEASGTFQRCETGDVTINNVSYGETNCLDVSGVQWRILKDGEVYDECIGCEESITPSFADYGIYQIELTQENICGGATVTRNLNIRALPIANYEILERKYCYPAELTFVNHSQETVIRSWWDFIGDSTDVSLDSTYIGEHEHQYTEEGEYIPTLTVFDGYCYNQKDSLLVFEDLCEDLYVPNAFIPGSDNPDLNSFRPKAQKLLEYRLEIFNLQGERLWASQELTDGYPAEGWDGTYAGELCPQGTYIWKIYAVIDQGDFGERNWEGQTYKERENKEDKKSTSGTFLLIR